MPPSRGQQIRDSDAQLNEFRPLESADKESAASISVDDMCKGEARRTDLRGCPDDGISVTVNVDPRALDE
jgi:hypothetical protein